MESSSAEATPTRASHHLQPYNHRYGNVKWYHAVNSQRMLVDTCQDITRTYYGDDATRRPSVERCPSVSTGGGAPVAVPIPSVSTVTYAPPPLPPPLPASHVFGIEADVQWHPSLETAVMRHDAVPAGTEAILAAGSPSSSPLNGQEDLFSLEVFLYTLAQAVQGWKSRVSSTATAVPPGPLCIILKLDFKALKAAQQFLSSAEGRTWAGLETLCLSATSSTRSCRRPSLRSMVSPRLETPISTSGTSEAATVAMSAPTFTVPPSVHVELWWNADVVAQPGAYVHPLSLAAAPPVTVQQLMARTALALGQRIPFGFSLGWVLCPRMVPPSVLVVAPTRNVTAPVYVAYSEKDDMPAMQTFLDGLATALACAPSNDTTTEAAGATTIVVDAAATTMSQHHGNTRNGVHRSHVQGVSRPELTSGHTPAACVHLFTFPMLFESVFADAYSEQEREGVFRAAAARGTPYVSHRESKPHGFTGAISPASTIASAQTSEESRRVAATVVAHTLRLFFPSERECSLGSNANKADSREGSQEPSSITTDVKSNYESRCFPTFWKAVKPPPRPPRPEGKEDAPSVAAEWQADVNRAARNFFPYCTIDG